MNCSSQTKSGHRCQLKASVGKHCHMHGKGFISDAKAFINKRISAIREGPASKPSSKLESFLNTNKIE